MRVIEFLSIFLVVGAYLTLLYNVGTLVVATLLRIKVEEINIGLGRRLFGFQYEHVQFNLRLWIILGGSCRLADYSAFPGLKPLPDEFRSASFSSTVLVICAGPLTLLLISIALLGFGDLLNSIRSIITSVAGFFFLTDARISTLQPFSWFRWTGFLALTLAAINLAPLPGWAGDRLIQTVLHRYFHDSRFVRRLYKRLSDILFWVVLFFLLIHIVIDFFES